MDPGPHLAAPRPQLLCRQVLLVGKAPARLSVFPFPLRHPHFYVAELRSHFWFRLAPCVSQAYPRFISVESLVLRAGSLSCRLLPPLSGLGARGTVSLDCGLGAASTSWCWVAREIKPQPTLLTAKEKTTKSKTRSARPPADRSLHVCPHTARRLQTTQHLQPSVTL